VSRYNSQHEKKADNGLFRFAVSPRVERFFDS